MIKIHKKNIQKKLKAFTMLEILMITVIIWIGLLTVVTSITKAKITVNSTKQEVIATQLAKEGIEMVYQIRNTNLLKHKNYKDYCRLDKDPAESCNNLTTPNRINTWNYILIWSALKHINNNLNISNWINTWDLEFSICLTWWQRISCQWQKNQSKFWKFFRTIESKWLYIKDVSHTWGLQIFCPNSSAWWTVEDEDYTCWPWDDHHPMEFQFCSRVEYLWTKTDSVEICGILTNFFD